MGHDMRPASWGKESDWVSAKLKPCRCGGRAVAGTDTAGFWHVTCYCCQSGFSGPDDLGCETSAELLREWALHVAFEPTKAR